MRLLLRRSSSVRTSAARGTVTRLVIDVGNHADAWRCAAAEAELHYRSWLNGGTEDRRQAALAYLAAIDREERAAAEYREAWLACCSCAI